tara:strand:- start:900 stop:1439 length:540 start_codon:yes stop_codon:yes gene_type:complete
MGFDLYGEMPKMNKKETEYSTYSKYVDMDFSKKQDLFKENPEIQDKYYEEMNQYEEDNPGYYFRNNCWWWRPLWDFVYASCDDILTEDDYHSGSYNDGKVIDKEKALAIADRLDELIKDGTVLRHQVSYEADRAQAEEDNKGLKSTDDNYSWQASYPFDARNVEDFSKFCRESGGFSIC